MKNKKLNLQFNSLKIRVLLWFGSTISILLILFSVGFYYFYSQSVNTSIESKLYKKALYIKEQLKSNSDIKKILSSNSLSHIDITIFKKNKIIYQRRKIKPYNLYKYIKQDNSFYTIDNGETIKAIYKLKFKKPFSGTIILIKDNIDDKVENVVDTLLVLIPVLLILMLFFASKLIDKILIPIKNITKTAQKININRLTSKIEQPKDNDEIKELIDAFNSMITRLQEGFEQIERFNNDVSHELKTPLTVIIGEANLALRKLREPQEYQQSLKTIANEAKNMQKMINDLLILMHYTKENIEQTFTPIDLDTILIMVLEKYNTMAKEKNIKIHLDKLEAISYTGNSQLISIIFSNLIDNAIKYTPNGKNIYISLYKKDKHIHFIIKDEGIGIPKEKIDKITDRFYRVDESRNRAIKGFGLGLSIVQNSVVLHNAKMDISSQVDIGTTIKITF